MVMRTVIALATVLTAASSMHESARAQGATEISGAARAIDGGTLEFDRPEGPLRVRLTGVSAPPADADPYGAWAQMALDQLIDGREVTCTGIAEDGEALCTTPSVGDLSNWIIVNGFAAPAPGSEGDGYARAARSARNAKRGIWGQ